MRYNEEEHGHSYHPRPFFLGSSGVSPRSDIAGTPIGLGSADTVSLCLTLRLYLDIRYAKLSKAVPSTKGRDSYVAARLLRELQGDAAF